MGRRGRLVATVAAGVLAGLAGPAAAATPDTGPAGERAVHAAPYAGDLDAVSHATGPHAVSYAAHPRAGGAADAPDATVTPSASATSSTSPMSGADDADDADDAEADAPASDGTIADTGAGVLPWIAAAAAGALGVGAVVFAMIRRRSE
ncbi:hypothetical protein [Streptomyces sp. NPDC055189]